jgi:hypothetical protein
MHRRAEVLGVFDIAGIACEVECRDRGFLDFLLARYAEFATQVDAQLSLRVEVTADSPEELWGNWPGPFARIDRREGMLTIEGSGFRGTFDERSGQGSISQPSHPSPLEAFLTAICAGHLFRQEGFLLHAAAILADGGAYVFFGPSGSGKSTVAELIGEGIISDEIVAIRRDGDRYRVFGVPWRGQRRSAPLRGLFRLRQACETSFTPLSPAGALRQLVPNVFFPHPDSPEVAVFLEIAGELVTAVPCYEMRFTPDRAFWEAVHGLSL